MHASNKESRQMKKLTRGSVGAAACWLAGAALATTVTLDPGNGVETNVTERFSGEMDLVVNSGSSGGGIVRLNTLNSYSGTTTLGCGTLVADAMSATGHVSSVGADGLVKVGPGTFRYAGPAGGWTDRPFTNTVDKAHAAIFDISNDFTMAGNIQQTLGSFVKTGPGTLHLAAPGTNTLGRSSGLSDSTNGQGVRARWVPNANGDSPTLGFRSFYVLEGKVVIGEGGGTYLIGGGSDPSVGGWTAAAGEQEKEATLEIVGGNVEFAGWMMQGAMNGSTNTTPDRVPQSTVRVKGGRLYTGSSYSLGRNKPTYNNYPMLSRPRLEVQGGELYVKGQFVNGDDRGAHTTIEVTGGNVTVTKDTVTGRCSGSVDTTNTLVVTGMGTLSTTGLSSLKSGGSCWNVSVTNGGTITATGTSSNSAGVVNFYVARGGMLQVKPFLTYKGKTNIRVEDGGTFSMTKLQNANAAAATTVSVTDGGILEADDVQRDNGTMNLFFDGATLRKRSKGRHAFPRADAATVKLGAGGLTVSPIAASSFVMRCPFTTADGLEQDGGLVIDAVNNNSTNEFGTLAQAYTGPTVLKQGVLTFVDTGAMSPNSDFVWIGGIFLNRTMTQTVKSATFGAAGAVPKLSLRMDARYMPLAATDGVTVLGRPTLAVSILAAGTVSAATTPGGTYPIISAPVSSRTALETLAACAVLDGPSATYVKGSPVFAVTDDGTTATLAVTFTRGVEASAPAVAADATAVYNTLGGAANDTEVPGNLTIAELSGADIVGINTNATGCGTVTVSNVSADFTGKVVTGSGTVVMDSLAWVDDPTRLVLGPGTLKYTGTGETVPGLTLNAGMNKTAILDVANDLTLESVLIGTSAFMKTGPGDLTLKGSGAFNLANTNKGKSQMPGIGLYGDSPVDTFQYVTVADGRLIIGEEGGTEAEPYIVLSGCEIDVGGCTASAANGRQETAGEFVMNSGTVICNYLEPGYYNGSNGTYPEGGTLAKVTVNGGRLKPGTFQVGYDNMQTHVLSTLVTMTGGVFEIGTLNFQSVPGNPDCPPSTTWNQSGGITTCTAFNGGYTAIGGSTIKNNGAWGPGRMTLTNCTFAVYGTMTLKNGTDTEINVLADTVFETGAINGEGSASSVIRFDGGTWRGYTLPNSGSEVKNLTHLYLTRRTVLDTSGNLGIGLPQRQYFYVNQKVEADPDSTEEDIGFTVTGGGVAIFGTSTFNKSTLTGPIRVTGATTLCAKTTSFNNSSVEIEPGCSLRQWDQGVTVVSNLTLGAEGATDLVLIDLNQEKDAAKKLNNFVVTGNLDIRSSVAFRTHAHTAFHAFDMEPGSFTGLVYRAEIDLDLSKFTVPNDPLAKSITYSVVTVPSGTYAGWNALLVKIEMTAAGTPKTYEATGRVWTATESGGNWNVSANWNNETPPNGADEAANFLPATAANVPVALGGGALAGGLSLAASSSDNGYAFSGGMLRMASADSARSLPLVADSGAHVFSSPVAFLARVLVDTSTGASIDFAGGVSSGSTAILSNRGHATGGGEVRIHNPVGLSVLATGCGRTIVDSFDYMTSAGGLELGRGTLRYTGPSTTIPGFKLTAGGGGPAVLDIPAGTTLGVKTITASSTALVKIGAGDLKLTGNGSFTPGDVTHTFSSWTTMAVGDNGDAPTSGYQCFNVSQGRVIQGTVGDPNDAPVVTCNALGVGVDAVPGEDCAYIMNNGIFNATDKNIYLDYYHGYTKSVNTLFEMNCGVVTSKNVRTSHSGSKRGYIHPTVTVNGGEWVNTAEIQFGYQTITKAGYTSTLTVNGGRMSVGTTFYLVYLDTTSTDTSKKTTDGLVVVNGGELDVAGLFNFCRDAGNTGTVRLNGGLFKTENLTMTRGKGYLYFNGGMYAPYGAAAANRTLTGLTAAYVSTNGAVISTANAGGGAYTIAQNLLHDPALSGVDGGLLKTGDGLLTLSGANTYTGPTTVERGTLRVSGSLASGDLILCKEGVVDLGGGTGTYARVTSLDGSLSPQAVNGTLRVGERLTVGSTEGAYGTVFTTTNLTLAAGATFALTVDDSGTDGDLLMVEGDLTCEGALTVDFGRTAADPLTYGMKIPLAEVMGEITVPAKVSAENSGLDPVALSTSVKDGVLYVTLKTGGTLLIFR